MPTLQSVIEPPQHGEPLAIRCKRLQQRCLLKVFSLGLREELFPLKPKEIADRDKAGGTNPAATGRQHRRLWLTCQGNELGQCKRAP